MTSQKKVNTKQIVILVVSLFISFIFWFLPFWKENYFKFSTSDQFLMAISSFIALALIDLIWIEGNILAYKKSEFINWEINNQVEKELHNIRILFSSLVQTAETSNDLFVNHYFNKIQDLYSEIRHTTEKNELRVNENHLLAIDEELAAFEGAKERILRYTWLFLSDNKLFDSSNWRRYFEETIKLINQKKLNKVKILLLVPSYSFLELPRINKLLDFVKTTKNVECRVIINTMFEEICSDNGISTKSIDFGIYSDRLLFITDADGTENGLWIKDKKTILHFNKVFEMVWSTRGLSKENPSQSVTPMKFSDLFDFDENYREPEE